MLNTVRQKNWQKTQLWVLDETPDVSFTLAAQRTY
jgi:hypothetical protein